MSRLATDLGNALSETSGTRSAVKVLGTNGAEIPGFDAFSAEAQKKTISLLRAAKLHFAGAAAWETGEKAIEQTSEAIHQRMLAMIVKILAAGIKIGEIQAYHDAKDFRKLFADPGFQIIVGVQAIQISADSGAMEHVVNAHADNVVSIAQAMGLREKTGKETLHVWDMWYASIGATSMTMYTAGLNIGRKWREQEILDGIAQATGGIEVRE